MLLRPFSYLHTSCTSAMAQPHGLELKIPASLCSAKGAPEGSQVGCVSPLPCPHSQGAEAVLPCPRLSLLPRAVGQRREGPSGSSSWGWGSCGVTHRGAKG